MITFDSDLLAEWTDGHWVNGKPQKHATGFCNDTRLYNAGEIFLALHLEGGRDGHDFIANAAEKGAVGAIVQHVNPNISIPQLVVKDTLVAVQKIAQGYRQQFKGTVIGVTGSCGKTSTKDLLASILGKTQTLATKINLNNFLGVPLTITKIDPDQHKFAVIEGGVNLVGEMQGIAESMQPDYTLFTGIEPVHLEGLGSIDGIAREKCILGKYTKKRVFYPSSCLNLQAFKELPIHSTILAKFDENISVSGNAIQLFYYQIISDNNGLILKIFDKSKSQKAAFEVPSWTNGMMQNGALAILLAKELGITDDNIQKSLKQWTPPPYRGEVFKDRNKTFYVDCYNANPASMCDRIETFRMQSGNNARMLVIGAMGELGQNSDQLHFEVGKKISQNISPSETILVINEKASALKEALLCNQFPQNRLQFFNTKEEAKPLIDNFTGDILIKGSKFLKLWELLPKQFQHDDSCH